MSGVMGRAGSRRCPRCDEARVVPIVYGFPSAELEADARAGRVVLGGCSPDGTEPTRHCRSCGHEWRPERRGGVPSLRGSSGHGSSPAPPPSWGTADDTPEVLDLEVDAVALERALGLFGRWLPKAQQGAEASLWLEGTRLTVRIGSDEARVPARGSWPGIVVVPAALLLSLREELGSRPHVRLAVEGDRVRLGPSLSVRLELRSLRAAWPEFIELGRSPRLLERLLLPSRHSRESIRYSGLEQSVREADSKLEELLDGLRDEIHDVAVRKELDAEEAVEAIEGLVERGLGRGIGDVR